MKNTMVDPLEYYIEQSPMSDPREHAHLFGPLPKDTRKLCETVQGLMVHVFWLQRYGLKLAKERQEEVQLRYTSRRLAKIQEMNPTSLTIARPLQDRILGNCRDFSLLLCSILRYQGIPARARCGFATYFRPNHYEDHWIVEYWHEGRQDWVAVDPQLDDLQCDVLGIDFDPCDLPKGKFIPAGMAWQMCHRGQANPDSFGIFDMHGLWFIRGNLLRDMASLNKIELLPWDVWGIMKVEDDALSHGDLALLHRVSELTCRGNQGFAEVRAIYEAEPRIRAPRVITSYTDNGPIEIELEI